jgi:hypothetical protein
MKGRAGVGNFRLLESERKLSDYYSISSMPRIIIQISVVLKIYC